MERPGCSSKFITNSLDIRSMCYLIRGNNHLRLVFLELAQQVPVRNDTSLYPFQRNWNEIDFFFFFCVSSHANHQLVYLRSSYHTILVCFSPPLPTTHPPTTTSSVISVNVRISKRISVVSPRHSHTCNQPPGPLMECRIVERPIEEGGILGHKPSCWPTNSNTHTYTHTKIQLLRAIITLWQPSNSNKCCWKVSISREKKFHDSCIEHEIKIKELSSTHPHYLELSSSKLSMGFINQFVKKRKTSLSCLRAGSRCTYEHASI